MSIHDNDGVSEAFQLLIDEIGTAIQQFNQEVTAAINSGDYSAAKSMIERLEKVTAFQEEVKALLQQWQTILSQWTTTGGHSDVPIQLVVKPLNCRLITHRKAYERPILEALIELGGSARAREVLRIVYKKIKPYLSRYDKQKIPSGTDFRWRKHACWCRYYMTREGLLADDSPQGIWEITPKGREYLSRLRPAQGGDIGSDA